MTTIQHWLDALERRGTRVWFSSGTSGHLSFVPRDESAARNLDAQVGTLVGPLLGGVEAAAGDDAILLSFYDGRQGLASAADKLASVTGRQTYLYHVAVTPDGARAAAKVTVVTGRTPAEICYSDMPLGAARPFIDKMKPHGTLAYTTATTQAAWKTVPATYIVCDEDKAFPVPAQQATAALLPKLRSTD